MSDPASHNIPHPYGPNGLIAPTDSTAPIAPPVRSLGVAAELRAQLRDVMVERHRVALGKSLGEGTAL